MQRGPSLVVAAVHVGAVLDQELHHVQVVVDARLENKIKVKSGLAANLKEGPSAAKSNISRHFMQLHASEYNQEGSLPVIFVIVMIRTLSFRICAEGEHSRYLIVNRVFNDFI